MGVRERKEARIPEFQLGQDGGAMHGSGGSVWRGGSEEGFFVFCFFKLLGWRRLQVILMETSGKQSRARWQLSILEASLEVDKIMLAGKGRGWWPEPWWWPIKNEDWVSLLSMACSLGHSSRTSTDLQNEGANEWMNLIVSSNCFVIRELFLFLLGSGGGGGGDSSASV